MKPGRFLRVALCLFSALLITTLSAKADTNPDNSYQSAVWVAETDGVLKLAASDGSVLFEIGSNESIDALALDEKRGLLWTYGSGILSAYTFDGALNSQHQYKASQSKAAKTLLKVSSTDGSVWLVSDNTLFHYTSTDGLLSSLSHNGITGVSVSPQSATVWVSDNQAVYQVNEANNTLQLNSVFDAGSSIQAIQYDEYLQELWIATSSKLLRIDQYGRVVANVSLSRLELLASDIRGGLWAGVEHRLYRIDASGLIEIDLTLPQPRGGGQVTAMAADMSDGTLWVANRKSIIHLGRSGEVLQ